MKSLTIGLVGNPNCGKTTLFNALTGSQQKVGNWPGVTVERKTGIFTSGPTTIHVVDLPGTYSLVSADTSSLDEQIACEYILGGEADVIVNILDASSLERNLYLTLQLLEMRVPMIVVLNMMDVAAQRKMKILIDDLAEELGCQVIAVEAHKGKGVEVLKQALVEQKFKCGEVRHFREKVELHSTIKILTQEISKSVGSAFQNKKEWLAVRILEGDRLALELVGELKQIDWAANPGCAQATEDFDILVADARYGFIQKLISKCLVTSSDQIKNWTHRIDNVVLNRWLGIPVFLTIMYCMFLFAINIGGAFQDFFDISSNVVCVQGVGALLTSWHVPNWLIALIANGVGRGINTTLTFVPVIGAMFLFLALLEDSGYMARAAFVIDRLMRALGLPGKSFVPMIVGFGCNVPAVMAARNLENKRDRILTVMMSPFMSCGARLAIYAVFTAAFFPTGGQNVVFALYVIGIAMAMLTGLFLRKTVLQGDPAPLVMELPPYHVPQIKTLVLHAWQRLKSFIVRAGKLIVPICLLLGMLNALDLDGSLSFGESDANSLLAQLGKLVTPIFAPMGIHQDNWPATVGLMTGVLAKEVVIGTLNQLYSQVGHFTSLPLESFHFWQGLRDAVMSIPQNLSQLGRALGNPVLAQAPVHNLNQDVYGLMFQRFDGKVGAFAYLLFVLLYFPCVSTTAAMLREVSRGWTIFSVCWTTGIAYAAAVLFYQIATFGSHPGNSLVWVIIIVSVLSIVLMSAKTYAKPKKRFKTLLPTGEVV